MKEDFFAKSPREQRREREGRENAWLSASMGKLPPQAIEAEEAVIGSALSSTLDAREALIILPTEKFFYKEAHMRIWNAIVLLNALGNGIDIITVAQQLRTLGELEICGGMHYLTSLNIKVSSAAHLQEHCLIVKQTWIKREVLAMSSRLMQLAYEDTTDAFKLLSEARQQLDDVTKDAEVAKASLISDVANESVKEAAQKMGQPLNTIFLPSGIPEFDRKVGGFRKGEPDLVILGSRPGMGKSSILSWIAAYQIDHSVPVGVVTLEMSKKQLVDRMLIGLSEGQMTGDDLQYGQFNQDQYTFFERAAAKTYNVPCPIYDKGGLDVRMLRVIALQWKEQYGIELLLIDFLQLMRYGDISDALKRNTEISIALKTLAKELGIPIVCLASLTRGPDARPDHRPTISDLRESGQIESDADMVILLLREHHYDKSVDYRDILMIIDKYRHGSTGDIEVYFDVATNRPVNNSFSVLPPRPNYKEFSEPLPKDNIEPDF